MLRKKGNARLDEDICVHIFTASAGSSSGRKRLPESSSTTSRDKRNYQRLTSPTAR